MRKYFLPFLLFGFILQNKAQTVTDVDGNVYNTLALGTQIWMKENLRVTKYSNGDAIPTTVPATLSVITETSPKYQWAYNADESGVATMGRLYTWYAATDSRNVCPVNWHLPTKAEWTKLTDYLTNNGYGYEGSGDDIAKSIATTSGWIANSTPGNVGNDQISNNASGFSLPATGMRGNGSFSGIGYMTRIWGADLTSSYGNNYGYVLCITTDYSMKQPGNGDNPKDGYSIRCLKNDVVNATNNLDNNNGCHIYPNPTSDKLFVKNIQSSTAVLTIFDLQGKQVFNTKIGSSFIDISGLPKGIYVVKIFDAEKMVIHKLIKE